MSTDSTSEVCDLADVELIVNGENVPMNDFVSNVLHDVVLSIVSHLRDIEIAEIKRIEVS